MRPWSVDSLDGEATDAMRKSPIEKKIRTLFLFWPPNCLFFLSDRRTDWTEMARHKSAIQRINRLWPDLSKASLSTY